MTSEYSHSKILPVDALVKRLEPIKRMNKTIVFTNGCFDILHAGHAHYLNEARREGDVLVVGVNSDASVKTIKGDKRPIISLEHRAEVLGGLSCVDFIAFFDEPDPLMLIQAIMPDVLVKGADWEEEQIIGADTVLAAGGRIKRIPITDDISTSSIIQTILDHYTTK